MAVPYHTHSFEIPSATKDEVEAGVRADVAATPASLGSAASKDISYFATSIEGGKANTAVQPTLELTAGDGLTGGGTLAANRTFALSSTSLASLALANSAVQSVNGKTGTSLVLSAADISALPASFGDEIAANTSARHTHANKSILDAVTAAYTTAQSNKLAGIAAGAQVNTVISVAGKTGAVVLNASDVGSAPDTLVPDINANTSARHTHTNKAILDATTASFLAVEKTKLAGIATGATANTGTVTSIGIVVPTGLSVSAPITTSGNIAISYAAGYTGYTTAEKTKLAGIPADADKTPALAAVATSGDYDDLGSRPTLGTLAAKNSVAIEDISASGMPSIGTFLRGDGTWGTVSGAGTVTSVGVSVPAGLTVSGSPITSAGTIAITYASGYQGYTTAEKTKLAGIAAGAQVNVPQVQSDWNAASGVSAIQNKPLLGTAAAQNMEAFATSGQGNKADNAVRYNEAQALTDTQKAQARSNIGSSNFGEGQTWQDLMGARIVDTVYVNNTGKPIFVSVTAIDGLGMDRYVRGELQIVDPVPLLMGSYSNGGSGGITAQGMIPAGSSYKVTWTGGFDPAEAVFLWSEFR